MISSSTELGTAVSTGRFKVGLTSSLSNYTALKEKGAPVEFLYPMEGGNYATVMYVGLIDGAPSPNAAKLLMNWFFTPEGIEATTKAGYLSTVPDAPAPNGIQRLDKVDEFKPTPLDEVPEVQGNTLAQLKTIFR
ncbi:MAG: extracellular solute-binding protein [Streptosporangiales bacterium]|nr:extracellular solute-binding protein [Streptosporangiales bacterium]